MGPRERAYGNRFRLTTVVPGSAHSHRKVYEPGVHAFIGFRSPHDMGDCLYQIFNDTFYITVPAMSVCGYAKKRSWVHLT